MQCLHNTLGNHPLIKELGDMRLAGNVSCVPEGSWRTWQALVSS